MLRYADFDQRVKVGRQDGPTKRIRATDQQISKEVNRARQDPGIDFALQRSARGRVRVIRRSFWKKGRPTVGIQGAPHGGADDSIDYIWTPPCVQELESSLVLIHRVVSYALFKLSLGVGALELITNEINHAGHTRHPVPANVIGVRHRRAYKKRNRAVPLVGGITEAVHQVGGLIKCVLHRRNSTMRGLAYLVRGERVHAGPSTIGPQRTQIPGHQSSDSASLCQ